MQQHTTTDANIGVPSRLCSVCGDISTGIHFGGNSCESCKAFFRRSVQCSRFQNYKCSSEERCPVNIVTRKVCQFCRYAKCTAIGMKPKWVLSDQEREEKYGARRKRFRENRTAEEDPDIYKFLSKEEKLLVEDIAHALYQSRATYPLNFPSPSVLFGLTGNASGEMPQSPAGEKPASASANLLIVPIQRLVLFARMLKDFDLFTEDDKVCLLKGSAIEMMVCSSSTLFNPKTYTFTNYLSRDQRAVMDDQVMPLDPLLTRLWGEEIFNRTRDYLIAMCNLNIDEVTSTLLAPVLLFSPDRPNIKDLDLVKRLQVKYVTLLRKYMNWRYGIEQSEKIYPKLLLQIVNVRTLSLAHGEVIQKLMATSSVNPLVQEVTIKQDLLNRATTERMDSLSISSSPPDPGSMDFDKTPSNDSNNGSDEEDLSKKQSRTSIDDEFDFYNDEIDGSDPRNIWRKRRKLTNAPQTSTGYSQSTGASNVNHPPPPPPPPVAPTSHHLTHQFTTNVESFPTPNSAPMRPYDHQVPTVLPILHDDVMLMSNNAGGFPLTNDFLHLPMKQQSLTASPQSIHQLQQLYQAHSSSTTDISSFDFDSPPSTSFGATMSPSMRQCYDEQQQNIYPQHYNTQTSPATFQQQQNEQQMHLLSLANNPSPPGSMQNYANPTNSHQSQSPAGTALNEEEQQLLNAIHAHPNKRDLVLSLLRQMNQSVSPPPPPPSASTMNYSGEQQRNLDPSSFPFDPYRQHPPNVNNDGRSS